MKTTTAGTIARIMNDREAVKNTDDRRTYTPATPNQVTITPSATDLVAGKEVYRLQIIQGTLAQQLNEFDSAVNA